jgi:hypothetical protein
MMSESIEDILKKIYENISNYRILHLRVIEKSKSILKLKIFITEEIFIQFYVNIKRDKKNLVLIFNDKRIYGKDFVNDRWHIHPFENPDDHIAYDTEENQNIYSKFIYESYYYISEILKLI